MRKTIQRLHSKHFIKIALIIFTVLKGTCGFAQLKDTIAIKPADLLPVNLKPGSLTYLVYTKKSKQAASEGIYLAKIKLEKMPYNDQPSYMITQQWDKDELIHTATTILREKDLSTLLHETYWKRTGQAITFDFDAKKVEFKTAVSDSAEKVITRDFYKSFESFNLNWHSDLLVFSALPYRKGVVFKINFYDPGFGPAHPVYYAVTGSEELTNSSGLKIPCWVLEHANLKEGKIIGAQKFWISKQTRQVLKQEDLFKGIYRYKLKLDVSEE